MEKKLLMNTFFYFSDRYQIAATGVKRELVLFTEDKGLVDRWMAEIQKRINELKRETCRL